MATDVGARRPDREQERSAGRGGGRGGVAWLLQVVTGALLVVLVVVHLVAQHFVVRSPGGLRDLAQVVDYLRNPVILVVESAFLVVVTAHALLGVRAILFDLGPGPALRRRIDRALWVLGAATIGYGFWLIAVIIG